MRPIAIDWFRILKVQVEKAQITHLHVMINGCALKFFLGTALGGLAREQQARLISEALGDHASITLAQGPNFQ
ncbi:hypothetical protein [Pseudomonas fluorescens]|uniref:Uncharacterized protein n=1 Tax=Pseudomonas fluorescens TaxID=294 RepID=A0A5E7VV19_PSEFL|nr:hypothetical protein [Pseudomonas fluorescens]VVQ26503.1 hypothetical protein PS928_06666 [Pseudomonas fluorescens]